MHTASYRTYSRQQRNEAVFIIYKGRLLQSALKNTRISINELLSSLRAQGVGDISDVEYALVEQNGSISVLERGKAKMAHSLIIDGEVIEETLRYLGYNDRWLKKELMKLGKSCDEIFLMTVNDEGEINVIEKENKK